MTKAEILEYFEDINFAYNDCSRYDSLSNMLDELEQEHYKDCEEAIKMLKEMQKARIYYEVRNTCDEYGTVKVTAKCDTLDEAKEVLSTHADWYCELGTGRIYKITQEMRFAKVKQTLVYKR